MHYSRSTRTIPRSVSGIKSDASRFSCRRDKIWYILRCFPKTSCMDFFRKISEISVKHLIRQTIKQRENVDLGPPYPPPIVFETFSFVLSVSFERGDSERGREIMQNAKSADLSTIFRMLEGRSTEIRWEKGYGKQLWRPDRKAFWLTTVFGSSSGHHRSPIKLTGPTCSSCQKKWEWLALRQAFSQIQPLSAWLDDLLFRTNLGLAV